MTIKCIIVDDEPIARKVIINHLENFGNIEIISECKNAIQAFEVLKREQIDLIFLDIQMPQINGLEFLKTIDNRPEVIITTAYRDYAVESFDFDVLDYLLKPISLERMLKAVNRYYDKHNPKTVQLASIERKYIYVKEKKITNKILLDDIIYLESNKEYVKINTKSGIVTTKSSLSSFCENLPKNHFLRIHNSFIIPINSVVSFSSTKITLKSGIELPVSRSYKNVVLDRLNDR